jgi:N-acetylmuramoyl-L-alanine amidase
MVMKMKHGQGRSRSYLIKWVLIASFMLFIALFTEPSKAEAAGAPILRLDSTAPDVWDLQYRLDLIGIPTSIDGTFGTETRNSVIQYQKKYGLTPDGVVGATTWRSLKRYTYTKADVDLLTRLVYSEARGETYKGQVAVAAVVINRIHSPQFPDTMRGVIFEKRAFTAVDDGQFWLNPNQNARKAAIDAIRGWDPSGDALFYFNPDVATSKWIWTRPQIKSIGKHIFTA